MCALIQSGGGTGPVKPGNDRFKPERAKSCRRQLLTDKREDKKALFSQKGLFVFRCASIDLLRNAKHKKD
jgi:hypothetical protein